MSKIKKQNFGSIKKEATVRVCHGGKITCLGSQNPTPSAVAAIAPGNSQFRAREGDEYTICVVTIPGRGRERDPVFRK